MYLEEDAKLFTPPASPSKRTTDNKPPYAMLRKTAEDKEFSFNASNLAQFWQNKGWGQHLPGCLTSLIIIKKKKDQE